MLEFETNVLECIETQIIDWLRDRDDEARRIARAGMAFAQRHLTRPGRLCYLRQLLREYASLFRRDTPAGASSEKRKSFCQDILCSTLVDVHGRLHSGS